MRNLYWCMFLMSNVDFWQKANLLSVLQSSPETLILHGISRVLPFFGLGTKAQKPQSDRHVLWPFPGECIISRGIVGSFWICVSTNTWQGNLNSILMKTMFCRLPQHPDLTSDGEATSCPLPPRHHPGISVNVTSTPARSASQPQPIHRSCFSYSKFCTTSYKVC